MVFVDWEAIKDLLERARKGREQEEDESSEYQQLRMQIQAEKDAIRIIEEASDDLLRIIRDISAETRGLRDLASKFPGSHPVNLEVNRVANALEKSNLELVDLKNRIFSSSRTVRHLVK